MFKDQRDKDHDVIPTTGRGGNFSFPMKIFLLTVEIFFPIKERPGQVLTKFDESEELGQAWAGTLTMSRPEMPRKFLSW